MTFLYYMLKFLSVVRYRYCCWYTRYFDKSFFDETFSVTPSAAVRLQDFGPKVNFKKRRVQAESFVGLPLYCKPIIDRFSDHSCLSGFVPVELCNLEYRPERGSAIDPRLPSITFRRAVYSYQRRTSSSNLPWQSSETDPVNSGASRNSGGGGEGGLAQIFKYRLPSLNKGPWVSSPFHSLLLLLFVTLSLAPLPFPS